jgi:butyrate kinase
MLDDLAAERYGAHPASLSALIGADLLREAGAAVPLFVVDPITIDTLWDEARISGMPGILRCGRLHALNTFRRVRQAAALLGRHVHDCDFVVGHFGSGVSIAAVAGGRAVDVNDAQLGEGPFSMTRAGTLPLRAVLELAYGEPDRERLQRRLSREGRLAASPATDFREVEKRLDAATRWRERPTARSSTRA